MVVPAKSAAEIVEIKIEGRIRISFVDVLPAPLVAEQARQLQ
jgi:hypothetical protein